MREITGGMNSKWKDLVTYGSALRQDSPGRCWFSSWFWSVWPRRALSSRPISRRRHRRPQPCCRASRFCRPRISGFPGSAVIRPADTRLPSPSNTIGPGDLYGHLTWVPFMGQAEFRSGSFGVITDFIHAPLKSGISTRDILFGGGTGNFTINTGSAVFLYRALALPEQNADIGLGFRAWGLDGQIALNPRRQRVSPVTVANGLSWADPLIAARYHYDFGNGFAATAYGDLGGFGVGAHFDWQLLGTIDYALRPGLDLHAGFRSLNFSYGAPRANISMNMNGPIISATFRF